MEHTFMTIHNLTPDCNILFASDSVTDILGWRPEDVHGRAVFDYFHPDEVQYARSIHSRGILLDKAASLHYVRVLSAQGRWVSCECCFTVVHDVLVACVSIYRHSARSERRALAGAQVRRIFSSSPRDPRYHMLEHLSPKFQVPPVEREPRAALILNRFTRNLTVMFATTAIASVLGLSPEQVKDKSFYRCIQERCLPEALKCLESAKANDSIAYLRFWSRDPREEEDFAREEEQMVDGDAGYDEDNEAANNQNGDSNNSDSDDGGAALGIPMEVDSRESSNPVIKQEENEEGTMGLLPLESGDSSGHYSSNGGSGSYFSPPAHGRPVQQQRSSVAAPIHRGASQEVRLRQHGRNARQSLPSVELEAVVSCTSDGLVVILRRARAPIPNAHPPLALPAWEFENGLFAAPWAQQPVRPYVPPEMLYTFQAPLLPQYMPLRENVKAAGGPPIEFLMQSIREVAVFAWALVGINGNFASHARGRPRGEAAPPDGLPIWDPRATDSGYQPPENQAAARWAAMDHHSGNGKGKAAETLHLAHEQPPPHHAHSSMYPGGQRHQQGFGDHQSDFPSYTTQRQDSYHQHNDNNYHQHANMPLPYQPTNAFALSTNQVSTAGPWRADQGTANSGEAPGTSAVPTTQPPHRPNSPRFDGGRGGFL